MADERGSIVAITDSSGGVISHNAYDPYGKPGGNNLGRFQYTGQQWLEDAGLYYYKARFYNADLGRFMQTDPIGYADGMNLYAYVRGDPVNMVDPSGLNRSSVTDPSTSPPPVPKCAQNDFDCITVTGGSRSPGGGSSPMYGGVVLGAFAGVHKGGGHGGSGAAASSSGASEQKHDEVVAYYGPYSSSYYAEMGAAAYLNQCGVYCSGAAADLTLDMVMFATGVSGLVRAAITRAGKAALGTVDEVVVTATSTQNIASGIATWIGPGGRVHITSSGNFVLTSKDGLRRFRIDFVQDGFGKFRGPHAQFEVRAFPNRPFEPAPGVNPHIYFGGQ